MCAGPPGVTLLELVAVTALLGIFAAVAANRSDGLFADAAARTEVERVAGMLHDAKRRAILTGDSHGVAFTKSAGKIVSVQIERETSPGTWAAAEDAVALLKGAGVTSTADHLRYTFEGIPSNGGVTVAFDGPNQGWSLWQPPFTGAVRISRAP